MGWLEGLITFLQVAAIVSGAVFAALALFTEYKKDGRVTKYGRIAVIGIVLSALFSLGTQWGQAKLDSERTKQANDEATKQLAAEARRFRRQMSGLRSLSRDLTALNNQNRELRDRAEASLAEILSVQARVGESLTATRQIGTQERRNTATVLRTMWEDANRINASSLALTVTYRCGPVTTGETFPLLLAENATATIRVASISPDQHAGLPNRRFSTQMLLDVETAAEFESTDQRVTVTRDRSVDGDEVNQVSYFTSFVAEDLKGFERPDRWSNVAIEVLVSGYGAPLTNAAQSLDDALGDKEALAEHYDVSRIADNDDYRVSFLPCPVYMYLLVNGRWVATAEGRLVRVWEWDEDVRGLAVVRFPIVAGNQDAFPRFRLAERD
jgi:hypothetical protein